MANRYEINIEGALVFLEKSLRDLELAGDPVVLRSNLAKSVDQVRTALGQMQRDIEELRTLAGLK